MILNCSNYKTAKESLAKIFNASESEIISILRNANPFDHLPQPPEDVLYEYLCSKIGAPSSDISVMWFHGTRVEDESLFHKHGILTKTEEKRFIEPQLRQMTDGLKRAGSGSFQPSCPNRFH